MVSQSGFKFWWLDLEDPRVCYAIVYVITSILFVEVLYRKVNFLKTRKAEKGEEIYVAYERWDAKDWSRWKFYLGSVLILPRTLWILVLIFLGWLAVRITSLGASQTEPHGPCRRRIVKGCISFFSRLILFGAGFFWIKRVDQRMIDAHTKRREFSPVWICNHTSWVDIFVFLIYGTPSFVSKGGVANFPFIGVIAKAIHSLFVKRTDTEDREGAVGMIETRIQDIARQEGRGYPPLLVFPEGTIANGKYLLPYKKAAFLTNHPIQPITLDYSFPFFSPDFTVMPMIHHFFLMLAQPYICLKMTYLPRHENLAGGWELNAQICRAAMAAALNVGTSDVRYRDKLVYLKKLYPDWNLEET